MTETQRHRNTETQTQREKCIYLIILIAARQYNGISSLTVTAVNTSNMRTMNAGLTRLNIHTHYVGIVYI